MRVFHGGTEIIEHPDINKGYAGLDFGQGFYVTDLLQQAESWADRMSRIRLETGVVNVYEFDLQQARNAFSYKKFNNYDVEWLDLEMNQGHSVIFEIATKCFILGSC